MEKISSRFAQSLLELLGTILWGFKPNLMKHIVEQHGASASLTWFIRNMPQYEKILKEWGAIRTHLISTQISVLNGCPYCIYGHAYALQLHYFKNTGTLLPIDENSMVNWSTLPESKIIDKFRQLVQSSALQPELPYFDRLLVLRHGEEQPTSADDHKAMHLLSMFKFLNQCGINSRAKSDQAHDPINKDTALRREYSRLRNQNTQNASTS